jgi:hypothetical protein
MVVHHVTSRLYLKNVKFKICKSVHHRTIKKNHQADATIFSVYYPDVFFTALHVWDVFPPIIRSSMTAVAASGFTFVSVVTVVLCSWAGRTARPRTQHNCHHDTKVKPEAATAVIELLMIGRKTPETC